MTQLRQTLTRSRKSERCDLVIECKYKDKQKPRLCKDGALLKDNYK